jgi:mercuric ion transport protein
MNSMSENPDGRTGGRLLNYLSLFTSVGTVLCCALPTLLVLVGLGATVVSFLSVVPWLVVLSHHKNWVFVVAGLLIAGNWLYLHGRRTRLCPADASGACESATRMSRIVLIVSTAIYCSGVFSAYLLGPLLIRFGP